MSFHNIKQYGPIVLTGDKSLIDSNLPVVWTNQEKATYQAIQFLINQGYRNIAYCTGGAFDKTKHGSSRNRGFIKALEDNQIDMKMEWIYKNVHTIEDGYRVARILLIMKNLSGLQRYFQEVMK